MSSISPVATKAFAQRIIAAGAEYIDAPVSGGEVGAKAGTLSIMVGGREEVYLQIKPILELMGKNITPSAMPVMVKRVKSLTKLLLH